MTHRKAKRMLNESDDFILFTMKKDGEHANFAVFNQAPESWEILLNLVIHDYHIRETFRNILTTADNFGNQQAEGEHE